MESKTIHSYIGIYDKGVFLNPPNSPLLLTHIETDYPIMSYEKRLLFYHNQYLLEKKLEASHVIIDNSFEMDEVHEEENGINNF